EKQFNPVNLAVLAHQVLFFTYLSMSRNLSLTSSSRPATAPIASILTFLFWQAPRFFNFAKSCEHFFVLFVNSRSLRQVDRLDEVSMRAGHYNKRIHAAEFPAAYVFIGYIGGVVHDVWIVHSDDAVAFFRVEISPQYGGQHV